MVTSSEPPRRPSGVLGLSDAQRKLLDAFQSVDDHSTGMAPRIDVTEKVGGGLMGSGVVHSREIGRAHV